MKDPSANGPVNYASDEQRRQPVLEIEAIYHRKDPILWRAADWRRLG